MHIADTHNQSLHRPKCRCIVFWPKTYNLLTAGMLHGYLADIEEQAQKLFLRLVKQYADAEGVMQEIVYA